MTGELVTTGPSSGSLALRADQTEWNPAQTAALVQLGIADAPAGDQAVFMHVCQRTGLDPFSRQIYMIGRKERDRDTGLDRVKWTIQTGIDGFRVIAERHPQYGGQLEPEWCDDDGVWRPVWPFRDRAPFAARVGVIRHDWRHPVYATVHFAEFAAKYRNGNLMAMWALDTGKPSHMIGKVGEAHALRKAFPQDLSGLFTDDEMAHVDHPGPTDGRGVVLEQTTPPPPALSVAELTGGGGSADDLAGDASPDGGRMLPAQQKRLLEARREVEVDDWWGWASSVVGRPVKSYGHLKGPDGDRLVAALTERAAAATAEQPDTPADEETPQQ